MPSKAPEIEDGCSSRPFEPAYSVKIWELSRADILDRLVQKALRTGRASIRSRKFQKRVEPSANTLVFCFWFSMFRFSAIAVSISCCVLAHSVIPACSCIPKGIKQEVADASIVFRGIVAKIEELPERKESGRPRYAVTFSVARYWKGKPSNQITIDILEPGTDCLGARFDEGKEYLVFAVSREAKDYWLEDTFWYGWLDVFPSGMHFLTVNNFCDSTAEVNRAGKTLRALGKGSAPAS